MSIQSNFPAVDPSLLLDFANTKQLDNRITFTRSTPAVYYDGKTTAMAEQNLLYPSVNIGSPYQNASNTLTNNTGTSPDGTTTASLLVPNTSNTRHYCSSPLSHVGTLNTPYTISLFAKPSGYNFIFVQFSGGVSSGGSRYGVTFNISTGAIESGGFSFSTGVASTSSTITSVGSGWYRITMTASMTSAVTNPMCYVQPMPLNGSTYADGGDGLPAYAGNGTDGAFFWGFQLEQRSFATAYTATTTQPITNYIPVLLSAGGNQARFDCNPTTGESLGLLIEEQRTNLFTYSSQFDDSGWTKSGASITANTIVAPDGTLTGDALVENTANTIHLGARSVSLTSGQSSTLSIYAKSNGRNISLYTSGVAGNVGRGFNLSTGVTQSAGLGYSDAPSFSITPVGNSWYRCTITVTASSTGSADFGFWTLDGSGSGTYTGNGFSGVHIWGAQVETGSFATSYIPTTGVAATRTADNASMTGTNFSSWFNASEGTMFATSTSMSASEVAPFAIEGTSPSRLRLSTTSSFYAFALYQNRNGTYVSTNTAPNTIPAINSFNNSAMTYSMSQIRVATQGTSAVSGTVTFSPSALTYLTIGNSPTDVTSMTQNGRIKKIAYYPISVTATQLQALTS